MSGAQETNDRIAIGAIRKPHGIHGEASVEPWTDSVERFHDFAHVTLVAPDGRELREVAIESVRAHSGRALILFSGIESPEEIARYRGWTVEIPASAAKALDPGEYFLHDLVGLTLVDDTGRDRGVVEEAYEGGGGTLLLVRHAGKTFEVPFAEAICKKIDLEGRRIVVDLPDGLDEV